MKPRRSPFLVVAGALIGIIAGAVIALAVTPAIAILLAVVAAVTPFVCLVAGVALGIERVSGVKFRRRSQPARDTSLSDALAEELKRIEDDMYQDPPTALGDEQR